MKKIISAILCLIIFLTGCKDSNVLPEPDPTPVEPVENNVKQVTLLYAVNRNNLSRALDLNERQIIESFKSLPEGEYVMLLFKTFYKDEDGNKKEVAGLFKAVSGPNVEFSLQKEYSRDVLSTDPVRIAEVVNDAMEEKGDVFNLFFWGHGMAWTPYFSDHKPTRGALNQTQGDTPELTSFGGDNNVDWADIDEICQALPDGKIETIWFDCCYMSNIETIYELRNKCRWMVAYPTEILSNGLPYHNVLPHILNDQQNLPAAAKALYDYYNNSNSPVTVTVLDMSKIENVAIACKQIYHSGEKRPATIGLQNYSQSASNPYYDFGQFVREFAQANDAESLLPSFNKALDELVVYTVASAKDFSYPVGKPIVPENYSGVSTHSFKNGSSAKEKYYMELAWYKATYLDEESE